MNKFMKYSIGAVMALGIIVLVWMFWKQNTRTQSKEEHQFTISQIVVQEPLLLEGSVETAKEQSYHVDLQKGQVAKIYVADGQEVAVGDPLFEYDNETLSDEISDLERQVIRLENERDNLYQELEKQQDRKAQASQEATQQLQSAQSSTIAPTAKVDLSAFDQAIEATQKAIRDMNNNIEDVALKVERLKKKSSSVVTAEIAGTVSVNQDAQTNVQLPLVKIISKDSVIRTTVSEYDYESLAKDENVTIYVKAQDREIIGTLSSIATEPLSSGAALSASTSTSALQTGGTGSSVARYAVMAKPAETLPNGFTVQVKVPQKDLVVLEQAVQKEGEQEYLYLYKDGKAVRQNIKRIKKGFRWIVTEGVRVGDAVIVNPDDTVSDGAVVSVKEDTKSEKAHD